eukprot:TRINITY_DN2237_c0_g1_i1.p2 TRINITY_DN2237_c0_g1~~TRINITY_DN2237_c0_g1_i1.p2  ORF type:complete len:118 (+),score=43.63 TRINITY_DN2237_c0_g1_i1:64-417(+)
MCIRDRLLTKWNQAFSKLNVSSVKPDSVASQSITDEALQDYCKEILRATIKMSCLCQVISSRDTSSNSLSGSTESFEQILSKGGLGNLFEQYWTKVCLLYTSPSPRDLSTSRMPSSA